MQIFSLSQTHFFLFSKKKYQRGFTLVELLITFAIIAIITGIVLVKYKAFDSTVLLKSAAYELSLNLRETQAKSVSVRGDGGSGINFRYYEDYQYIGISLDETCSVQDVQNIISVFEKIGTAEVEFEAGRPAIMVVPMGILRIDETTSLQLFVQSGDDRPTKILERKITYVEKATTSPTS